MRIADLQRWVCAEAGEEGWLKCDRKGFGPKVAVIGGGSAALSCAYYLGTAGCQVHVFAQEEHPENGVWRNGSAPMLKTEVKNDVRGLMYSGITYHGSQQFEESWDIHHWRKTYAAIYLDWASFSRFSVSFSPSNIVSEWSTANRCAGQVTGIPNVLAVKKFRKRKQFLYPGEISSLIIVSYVIVLLICFSTAAR